METKTATAIFEVLSSAARLAIFRLLVRHAPAGLVAGEIARMLAMSKTNLSFHLKVIVNSGLAGMEREGRNTRYKADIPLMLAAIAYLTAECCQGDPDQCREYRAASEVAPEFLPPGGGDNHFNLENMNMGSSEKNTASEEVRETVRSGYAAIATGQRSCCSSPRSGHLDPLRLAQAVGYDAASLANLPEGANMGLSCGNPVALAALLEGQVVLDLGSGGGFDVFQAGEKVKAAGRVIGVDMTPEMLAKARANIAHYRQRTGLDNVEFRLGEIEHLPVADASVDVVLSNCVINLSPDKPQVWRDIFRVLKPGGKVAVSDLALLKPLPENVRTLAAALVGCVAGAVLTEETGAMLAEAGFTAIVLTPKPDYVRKMQEWNDPLYQQIAETLPKGEEMADYVVSLSIEALK
ncbi:arsenite methyltransferase [Desulfobulbus sp.]|uniref:arsenite methyltransferase n=1 Tax=Desulfobulbus sp. TaxID=895 RepID=UPI00286FA5B1|nr:arsenite methyltransferase [Desulfobulbus sp.]